ncbi:hypothetical protein Q3C01_22480 [Bradyrhizobium sp. UFLA05-109]
MRDVYFFVLLNLLLNSRARQAGFGALDEKITATAFSRELAAMQRNAAAYGHSLRVIERRPHQRSLAPRGRSAAIVFSKLFY